MLRAKYYNLVAFILVTIIVFVSCSALNDKSEKTEYEGITFSHDSGHYKDEFKLKLSSSKKQATILYTLDGSLPIKGNKTTFEYKNPIPLKEIKISKQDLSYIPTTTQPEKPNYETWLTPKKTYNKGITVRSQLIFHNGLKNTVVTKTYFVDGLKPKLPEIYLTIDKGALFDNDTGIYVPGINQIEGKKYTGNFFKRGKEWERLAHLEYLSKEQKVKLNQNIGVRVHGMASPAAPMKTIKFYARKKYGEGKFKFSPFKQQTEIKSYKRLLLRTPYSTWNKRIIADQLAQNIVKDLDIECAASRPVSLYINGEYWGIHDMAEKIDQHFFKSHFGVHKDSLSYSTGSKKTNIGGKPEFSEVFYFAKNNDLTVKENYDSISKVIDINNFIDYTIIETYLDNWDWPGNNNERWRAPRVCDKWKWLIIDMDATFMKKDHSMLKKLMDTTDMKTEHRLNSTLIFRKLVENETFKSKLIKRYEELLSSTLCQERLLGIFEEYEELYENDIQRQIDRWTLPQSLEFYENKNEGIKEFIRERTKYIILDVKKYLGANINPICN